MFLDANFLIYLNLGVREVEEFYVKLVAEENLTVDPLVLDEVIYVSKKRYNVKYEDTVKFLDEIVLPNSTLLPITSEDYRKTKEFVIGGFKPSNAFHLAVMLNNSISKIVSEDRDFDKVSEIKRVWILRIELADIGKKLLRC
ncbi:PIN domain-containing protein [Sulfolobales archaeon HS-7]|nr:PIN domain-containing protein [Sulfolobales archaeon HS-7]